MTKDRAPEKAGVRTAPMADMMAAAPANGCNNNALRKATRNLGRLFDDVIEPSGLRAAQFGILVHIDGLDRPTVKALARALVMDLSALSHTLKPLIRDGFVQLAADLQDKRSKRVCLTPAGRAKCEETARLWHDAQTRFDEVLGAGNAQRLRDTLATIASEDFSSAFRGAKPPG